MGVGGRSTGPGTRAGAARSKRRQGFMSRHRSRDAVRRPQSAARAAGLVLALLAAVLRAGSAGAIDFTLGDTGITGSIRTQVSVGATVRAQDRDPSLIGKLNLPGQEQFCEDKPATGAPGINCLNEAGNAAYLALPGYPSANTDNGDLNYDKGELVSAAAKIAPRLQLSWENFG